jgi:hypothetical protein
VSEEHVGVGAHPGDLPRRRFPVQCPGFLADAAERAWAALDGIVGRRSASAGSAARSAARARPLDGVVPAGRRAARPWPACPASTSRSHAPGRTSVPGPGGLCRLPGTLARCQDWRDRHLRFRFDDRLQPLPDIGDLLREADRDPIAVVGREPVQAEASAQRRYLAVP